MTDLGNTQNSHLYTTFEVQTTPTKPKLFTVKYFIHVLKRMQHEQKKSFQT